MANAATQQQQYSWRPSLSLITYTQTIEWDDAYGGVSFTQSGNYVTAVVTITNSHYTYGHWNNPGNLNSAEIIDNRTIKIYLHERWSYTYTYTFTYKPEINANWRVVEADGTMQITEDITGLSASVVNPTSDNYYDPRNNNTISLSANSGNDDFYFDHWEGSAVANNKRTDNPYSYLVRSGDATFTAVFRKNPTVTIACRNVEADGSTPAQSTENTVTASYSSTSESTTSSHDLGLFSPTSTLSLSTSAADDFYFDHWEVTSGTVTNDTYIVGKTDNVTITAVFRRKTIVTITYRCVKEDGTTPITDDISNLSAYIVETDRTQNDYYTPTTPISLFATSNNDDFYFDHWERKKGNGTPQMLNNGVPYTYYVENTDAGQDITIIAVFRQNPELFVKCQAVGVDENQTLPGETGGYVICENNGARTQTTTGQGVGLFAPNSQVTLTAYPDRENDFCFDHWEVPGRLVDVNTEQYAHTMGARNTTITAVFRKAPPATDYGESNGFFIHPSCSGGYFLFDRWIDNTAKTANLIATTNNPNYEFEKWTIPVFGDRYDPKQYVSLIASRLTPYHAYFRKVKSTILFSCVDESGQLLPDTEQQEDHPDINSSFTPTLPDIDNCYELIRWDIFKASGECESIPNERTDYVTEDDTRFPNFSYLVDISDAEIHAVYQKKQFTIYAVVVDEATKEPIAGGIVSGAGTYVCGTSATLKAPTITCYTFVGWEQEVSENDWQPVVQNPLSETLTLSNISSDASYRAVYQENQYTISAGVVELKQGTYSSIDGFNVTGTGSKGCGTLATLEAPTITCYMFVGWEQEVSENDWQPVVQNPLSETLTLSNISSDASYRAVYQENQYTISTDVLEQGTNESVGGSVSGAGNYACGAEAQLTATADACYTFVKWSDGETVNPRTVTVTANVTYTAEFAPKALSPITAVQPDDNNETHGSVAVYKNAQPYDGPYYCGDRLVLRANPESDCYVFEKWTDNNTENPRSIRLDADAIPYTAVFKPQTISVSVESEDESKGEVEDISGINYHCGVITLTAKPKDCYRFTHWTDINNGRNVDYYPTTDNSITDADGQVRMNIALNGNPNTFRFVAHFEKVTYTVTAIPDDPNHGSTIVTIVTP